MATVVDRIRSLMNARGLSQTRLNDLSGLAQGSLSRIIRGKRSPEYLTLEALAAVLQTTPEYLSRGAAPKEGPRFPEEWGWTRAEVAARVLVARGHTAGEAEAAARVIQDPEWARARKLEPLTEKTRIEQWIRYAEVAIGDRPYLATDRALAAFRVAEPEPQPMQHRTQALAGSLEVARSVACAVVEETGISLDEARALTGLIALDEEQEWSDRFDLYRAVMKAYRDGRTPSVPAPPISVKGAPGIAPGDIGFEIPGEDKTERSPHPRERAKPKRN